ncbi:MAG TPA: type II toxin-antitoxin system VapC family toxin [Pyrinomonadaceae bacterium]|jgi:predicted nucleic acid-binding protein
MPTYFFDTSALQHRYFDSDYSKRVRYIISNTKNDCFIADLTILEIASAIGNRCRQGYLRNERYDEADKKFWTDVSTGRLTTRITTPREVVRARDLLRYAGIIKRRKLGSADALIAVCALELALELKERVIFYTGDWGLYSIIRDIDAYNLTLRLRFLGIPKY